jgi:hypothetical protein
MTSTSTKKFKKALSESCLIPRNNSFHCSTFKNDPFRAMATSNKKTPSVKPTCHKVLLHKAISKLPTQEIAKPKLKELSLAKIHPSIFKSSISSKITHTTNPNFTAKNSEHKAFIFEKVKPVTRPQRFTLINNKLENINIKVPSLNKKTVKRVNNLVFKFEKKQNKSVLDFSFGDPE